LTVRSRPQGGTTGAELTVEGGNVGEIQPAGCPEGTTVEVADLFFNTPARKKFLKRDSTEFDHINTVVSQYALANPDVAVTLSHNDRELFGTEGSGSLRSAVLSVYGREVAESMIEIEYSAGEDEPVDSITGLISHPETTRSTRAYLATFVNERYVTASALRGAVVDGYGGQLAVDRYPFAVLFVEVPPTAVDVNVHPRKTEVRFDHEDRVMELIGEAVERTLVDSGLIRSSAPRGRSAPEETQITPERTEQVDEETDTSREQADGTTTNAASQPNTGTTADETSEPATDTETTPDTNCEGETPNTEAVAADPVDPADEDSWTVDGLGSDTQSATVRSEDDNQGTSVGDEASTAGPNSGSTTDSIPVASDESKESDTVDTESLGEQSTDRTGRRQHTVAEPTTQQTLNGGETTDGRSYEKLPALRVLGQLYDTYLLAETDSGLVLIDQHAADERVNYERLQVELADSPSTQQLAEPVSLELTAREAALFDDHSHQLTAVGFQAEQKEPRSVDVTAVPAVFSTTLDPELLREALLSFVASTEEGADSVDEAVDELLADLACYPSITGNTSLTDGSVVDLLAALDDCENPYACPHGRPVIIEISREEITDRFERDYPGHGGRRNE